MRLSMVALVVLPLMAACGRDTTPRAVGQLAWDRVELIAESAEPIIAIDVREGQNVAAGDRVVQQELTRATAVARQAAAARRQAEARLAEVERGTRQEQVDAARADLEGAEAALDAASREYARLQRLEAQRLISPDALDQARATRDRAQSARSGARSRLNELVHGATREQLLQIQAALEQAQAAEGAANVTLERLTVRAPRPGRIDSLPFQVGDRPNAGATVAVMLVGDAPYARIYVPEALRARVAPGTAAQIHVDGVAQPFAGKVRRISSEAAFTPYFALTQHDRARLSYVAEVVLEGNVGNLAAGVPVEVTFGGFKP